MLKRDLYKLENIEKIITYTPTIFILILSSVILFVSFAFIHSKEKKEIQSIKEKAILRYQFHEKEKLHNFVSSVRKDVNKEIMGTKTKLQNMLFKSVGYIKRLDEEGKGLNYIISYLDGLEQVDGVAFVLFGKEDFKVYKGKYLISYIRELVFGEKEKKKHDELMLKYIYSQGGDNFQYWIDDIRNSVRVSYFDRIKIGGKLFYIGVFSNINSLRYITKDVITKKITKGRDDYIWMYDIAEKDVFNFFDKKMFYKPDDLLKHESSGIKYTILKYYTKHENEAFEDRVYLMDKFKFVLAIEYNYKNAFINKTKDIKRIKNYYESLFYKILAAVFFISLLLIVSSIIFSKFVKRVFARYNRRLYLRKESLQHWKKRFELAIIASNDGMWDIDFEKNSIYFSKKWLEISGYERDDIKTFSDWFALIHSDDKDKVQVQFDEIMARKREHIICEYRLKTKYDGYKWILARGKIFKNDKNEYKRMLMMSMDIDKNKRLSKELTNVELLVEDGNITILKWKNDERLSVGFVSNSIKTYGYYKDDFVQGNIAYLDIVHNEDRELLKKSIKNAITQNQKSFSLVYRIVDNSGKIRWIFSRVLLLRDDFGEVKQLYGYIHDISKLKNAEEELRKRVKEEIEKNRQKDAFIVQQNKLASMGGMLGSIAHQWRQPLNNVGLILHFIKDNCGSQNFSKEMLQEYIQRAKRQIEYMSQTIDDFRNFYKPSKSKNIFDLGSSIETTLKLIYNQFEDKNIKIDLFVKEKIMLYGYENELKQSILNILNNAKDAIISRREKVKFDAIVKIVIKRVEGNRIKNMFEKFDNKKNFAIISIENNGGKIDESIIDRIFEPYFTTKFETQGTGIGLYMTKVIIEKNLKGKIVVKNKEDGVVFEIILPIEELENGSQNQSFIG